MFIAYLFLLLVSILLIYSYFVESVNRLVKNPLHKLLLFQAPLLVYVLFRVRELVYLSFTPQFLLLRQQQD